MASIVAALGMTLPALLSAGSGLWDGRILLIGALVGLLVTVIPYSCELVALRSLRPAVFGILMSLEPAAAALAAIVVLNEHLSALQWLAIACVWLPHRATGPARRPGRSPGARTPTRHTGHMTVRSGPPWSPPRSSGRHHGLLEQRARPPAAHDAAHRPAEPAHAQRSRARSRAARGAATSGGPRAVGTLVDLLAVPWGIDFLPDGRAIVTERDTERVLLVAPDGGDPSRRPHEASPAGRGRPARRGGLPDFARDRRCSSTLPPGRQPGACAHLRGRRPRGDRPSCSRDPHGVHHDGGRMVFGPDGFLYVSTGEAGDRPIWPRTPTRSRGKILRITPDGEPAPGNPTPVSPVWTLGHRNVQGLACDDDGRLWASEFGETT